MSDVMQFLESMGRNPAVSMLSTAHYAAAVAALDLDAPQRKALLDRDHVALASALGGPSIMRCLIAVPE